MANNSFHLFKQNTDAIATNQGFYFQYIATLQRWILNYISSSDEVIYCEYEDDIFLKNEKTNELEFTQLKCYTGYFNLQHKAVIESLLHFYQLFLKYKDEHHVKFVFETNCSTNQKGTSEGAKLLVKWVENQRQLPTEEFNQILVFLRKKFVEVLTSRGNVKIHEKNSNEKDVNQVRREFEALNKSIHGDDFIDFVTKVEWDFHHKTKGDSIKTIEDNCLNKIGELKGFDSDKDPKVLFTLLLHNVIDSSSNESIERRKLTHELFQKQIDIANTSDKTLKSLDSKTDLIIQNLGHVDEGVGLMKV